MSIKTLIKKQLKNELQDNVKYISRKTLKHAKPEEIYEAIVKTIRDLIMDQWIETAQVYDELNVKTVYYLSMEFLLGRALSNNLINLSIYDEIREIFDETERVGFYEIKIASRNNPLIDEDVMTGLNDGIDLYVEYLKSGVAQNLNAVKNMQNKLFVECVGGCAYRTLSRVLERLNIFDKYIWNNKEIVL